MLHDLFPGRILNRAYGSFSDHGDDSYGTLRRSGLASAAAPLLRRNRGRGPGRTCTGHARATIAAESGSAQRGGQWSCSREAAPGELEEASSSGGGESGRHGRTWRKRAAGLELSSSSLPGPFLPDWAWLDPYDKKWTSLINCSRNSGRFIYIENKRKQFQNSRPQMLPFPSPRMKPHKFSNPRPPNSNLPPTPVRRLLPTPEPAIAMATKLFLALQCVQCDTMQVRAPRRCRRRTPPQNSIRSN
jgi:hypothetical protein